MSDEYTHEQWYIPARMMTSLRRYIDMGVPPADFLHAVLCNDLKEAVGRGDDENLANLPAFVVFLYNEAPGSCWGSAENVAAWIESKRIENGR